MYTYEKKKSVQKKSKPNSIGIPDQMKQQYENISGYSFDDVRVHYNSIKPAQLQALPYTQGSNVFIGSGKEKHPEYELGHVIQQKQGRVRQTANVNNDLILQSETDKINDQQKLIDPVYKFPIQRKTDTANNLVIQCFPNMSRTLKHEKKKIDIDIESIRDKANMMDVESEFDDDFTDVMGEYFMLKSNSEILHHILPQNAIKAFISKLDDTKKREILIKFLRYNPDTPTKNDVTAEEYASIMQGESGIINEMLTRTLLSLRSNLTLGPSGREDDPKGKKDDFDPNYKGGELDDISKIYRLAYERIEELKQLSPSHEKYLELLDEVPVLFESAEKMLAVKQGKIYNSAYLDTELESYDSTKWCIGGLGKPRKSGN